MNFVPQFLLVKWGDYRGAVHRPGALLHQRAKCSAKVIRRFRILEHIPLSPRGDFIIPIDLSDNGFRTITDATAPMKSWPLSGQTRNIDLN
jgi:hypothetical protein